MRSRETIQNQEERILRLEQRLEALEAEVKQLKDGEKAGKAPAKTAGKAAVKK